MLIGSVRVSYEPPVDDPFVHIRSLRDYRVRKWFQSRDSVVCWWLRMTHQLVQC